MGLPEELSLAERLGEGGVHFVEPHDALFRVDGYPEVGQIDKLGRNPGHQVGFE
jgi:hypothetical protein